MDDDALTPDDVAKFTVFIQRMNTSPRSVTPEDCAAIEPSYEKRFRAWRRWGPWRVNSCGDSTVAQYDCCIRAMEQDAQCAFTADVRELPTRLKTWLRTESPLKRAEVLERWRIRRTYE